MFLKNSSIRQFFGKYWMVIFSFFSGVAQGSSALMIFAPWTKPKVKKKEMQTQRKNAQRSAITFGARKRPGASTERTNYKVSLIVFLFGEILDLSSTYLPPRARDS